MYNFLPDIYIYIYIYIIYIYIYILISIPREISMDTEKFKDSIIGWRTIIEKIEKIKIIERSVKKYKKVTQENC